MLSIELRSKKTEFATQDDLELEAVYTNSGAEAFSLTFWWNRRMRVTDSTGKEIAPGPGPVLPCGVAEDVETLAPGKSLTRDEYVGCTQPAGESRDIGWGYELGAGTYTVTLIFEYPPKHGRLESDAKDAWRGRVESNPVTFTLAAAKKKPRKKILGLF